MSWSAGRGILQGKSMVHGIWRGLQCYQRETLVNSQADLIYAAVNAANL